MQPESAKFLRDVADAAQRIVQYTQKATRESFLADQEMRDAVHWNFAIAGEALNQLHKRDAELAEQITEWRRIIAFRNQLIHGYGVIKNDITWDIIENKIPQLQADIRRLLQ